MATSSSSTSSATKLLTAAASLTHMRRPMATCSAARLVPQPPDLIRWVKREGGSVHPSLKIANDGASPSLGATVLSTQPIPDGSDLISLPSTLPLCFDSSVEPGSALDRLARRVPEELWAMRLGLKLLQERAEVGSFWWPYISNLPEAFSLPIFFSGEDIKGLQYAPLLHQVNKRCRFLLEFEKEVKSLLADVTPKDHPFGGQNVDASSLGWAMSAVSSRAFRLHGEILPGGKHTDVPMLLPLIDMCNHSFKPNARIVQERDSSSSKMLVKVVAERHIEQDTPVTLNYGCLTNDLFLLDYGFVIPSNPYDITELKYDGNLLDAASMVAGVSSPNFSSPEEWQQEILTKLNLMGDNAVLKSAFLGTSIKLPDFEYRTHTRNRITDNGRYTRYIGRDDIMVVTLGGQGLVDGRLLAALRVLLTRDREAVEKLDLDSLMSLSADTPLGLPIETAALRTVIALCVVALEYFPTKVMRDEAILKGGISNSMQLAVQFRMQKKLLLIDVMRKLTQRVRMLSKDKTAA